MVESVSFNYGERDMVYEVVYADGEKGAIADDISEHNLAYGASCPVTVSIDSNGGGSCDEGTILLSEPSSADPGKFVYTVMIPMNGSRARFERGISAMRIKYRKVKRDAENADVTDMAAASPPDPPSATNKDPSTAHISVSASAIHRVEGEVSSSITCGSVAKSKSKDRGVVSSSKRKHADIASPLVAPRSKLQVDTSAAINDAHYRQDSRRSLNSCDEHESRMTMKIPAWLQRDVQSQRDIFFHLIGSKMDKRGRRTVYDVQRESNCGVRVNFNNRSPRCRDNIHVPANPITITVQSFSRATALRDLDYARELLQDLLLDYMDVVHDDGSKNRMLYEVASTIIIVQGDKNVDILQDLRPRDSTSRAVRTKNDGFMTIVELPFTSKKDYHAGYLLVYPVLSRIKKNNCRIKVCGNQFRVPLKLCDPHVVVTGRRWQDVDSAVAVLQQFIRGHMSKCTCHF